MTEPKLRAVREGELDDLYERALAGGTGRATPAWIPLALAAALLICLGMLVWSRAELGGRIAELEAETQVLRTQVADQQRTIDGQTRRLAQVRDGLDGLRTLLEQPLPEP